MGEYVRTLGVALVLIGFIVLSAVFGLNYTAQTSLANQFQQTVQADTYANRDDSARSKRGEFYLTQSAFEKNVSDDIAVGKRVVKPQTTDNQDTANDGINFSYLVANPDGKTSTVTKIPDGYSVKAIKVKTTINGKKYETNAVISIGRSTASNDITNRDKDTK